MNTNIFYSNTACKEVIDTVRDEGWFRSPYIAPACLPVSSKTLYAPHIPAIYRHTSAPDTLLHGRSWNALIGSSSLPISSGHKRRSLDISLEEFYRQEQAVHEELKPILRNIESTLELDFYTFDLFIVHALIGRFTDGPSIKYLYELFFQILKSNGIPCGWIGTFPDDMKVGDYPLDGTVVVYSPVSDNSI